MVEASSLLNNLARSSAFNLNPSCPGCCPSKQRLGFRLLSKTFAPATSVSSESVELMKSHSRQLSSYSLVAGPLPRLRSFFAAADGSTLNQSLRALGNSAASCVFTQSAIDTWTLASPDHGWFSTASTIVPVFTT